MSKPTVEDYIQQGIYGPKELRPDEKRLYLGTFRERVIVALTHQQVKQNEVSLEVAKLMQQNRNAHLYLNGHIDYSFLSKYIQKANEYDMSYTMVTNKDYNSKYGLVLANDQAINKENIHINESDVQSADSLVSQQKGNEKGKPKQSFFSRLFKKK